MHRRPLRIGVDARLLSEPTTGIGRYLFEILSRMVEEGHEWFLYSHQPIIIGSWNRKNIFIRSLNLKGRPMRMLWAQSILPYWAHQDHVDIFWGPAHRIPRFLPSKILSVVTIHDLVWRYAGETMRPLSRWLDSKFMIEAAQKSDAIIAVSNSTEEDLMVEDKNFALKTTVISLGISPCLKTNFSGDEQIASEVTFPYYLFVGTLEPRKNLKRLIEAVSILPNDCKNIAKLVIVGGKGWGGVDVEDIIKKFGVQDNIKHLGYVDDSTLAGLYSNALFLVMPSLYEGFGLPLIEAARRHVPIIARDIPVFKEVAGEHAFYYTANKPEEMTQAIEAWLKLYASGTHPRSDKMPWLTWKESAQSVLKTLLN